MKEERNWISAVETLLGLIQTLQRALEGFGGGIEHLKVLASDLALNFGLAKVLLGAATIVDKEPLRMFREGKTPKIQVMAIKLIKDDAVLMQILTMPEQEEAVAQAAAQQISDKQLLFRWLTENTVTELWHESGMGVPDLRYSRAVAIASLGSDEMLLTLINTPRVAHFEVMYAVGNIKDQNQLRHLALSHLDSKVRREAIANLTDVELLQRLARGDSWYIAREAAEYRLRKLAES